jgi:hypothetical protein
LKKFDNNFSRIVAMKFSAGHENSANPDKDLASQVKELNGIQTAVNLFQKALTSSCNKSFKIRRGDKENHKVQISSIVDRRVNSHEEKNQCPKI